jgi:type II secretory pathway pseudopilin PulG
VSHAPKTLSTRRPAPSAARGARADRAFTLIELLVVVIIGIITLLIAIPAFNGLVSSQKGDASVNFVQSAIRAARDLASRSATGEDTAAVFAFEPGGRLQILIAVRAGELIDLDSQGREVARDVFVPVPGSEAVELPAGWMVRGWAPPGMINAEWYATQPGQLRFNTTLGAWVFPETGFYDHTQATNSRDRNTFMVRFQGGTGQLSSGDTRLALVVMVRPSSSQRPLGNLPSWTRPDLVTTGPTQPASGAPDLRRWAARVLGTADVNADGVVNAQDDDLRRQVLGARSSDVVRARSVDLIAVYDELRLAQDLGVRVDRISRSLMFVDPVQWASEKRLRPQLVPVPGLSNGTDERALNAALAQWIEGMDLRTGRLGATQPARILVVTRFGAQPRTLDLPARVGEGAAMPTVTSGVTP